MFVLASLAVSVSGALLCGYGIRRESKTVRGIGFAVIFVPWIWLIVAGLIWGD